MLQGDDGAGYLSSQIYETAYITFGTSKIGIYNDAYDVWYDTNSENKKILTYKSKGGNETLRKIQLINID